MRGRRLFRIWQLIALLRSCGGLSLASLAEQSGVTPRTIRRDLAVLEESYVPVEQLEDGRWRLLKGAPCPVCAHKQVA